MTYPIYIDKEMADILYKGGFCVPIARAAGKSWLTHVVAIIISHGSEATKYDLVVLEASMKRLSSDDMRNVHYEIGKIKQEAIDSEDTP